MRSRTPPSFTVETKSGGRHQRTFIPHRAVGPVAQRPLMSWPLMAEPRAPTAEPRRILPNLIVTEAPPDEAEPTPVAEEFTVKRRRGRPPKAKAVATAMVEEPIAEAAVEIEAVEPVPVPPPSAPCPVRAAKPAADLPAGERWKRRLGRWAR